MIVKTLNRLITFISESLLFPSYSTRKRLAFHYLHGIGLELGALHHPLETPPGVVVRYLDLVTRDENIRRYPHVAETRIVPTDILDDGFTLTTIADASQDFIIANHLLEHAPNTLQTLVNWHRVLKPNGTLFITLPIGDKNFDRGREVTSLVHFVEDYKLAKNRNLNQFAQRNREHYKEFVEISLQNLNLMRRRRPMTLERQQEYLEQLIAGESTDPHFHVFSKESILLLFNYFITTSAPDLSLRETARSRLGQEYVVILRKSP